MKSTAKYNLQIARKRDCKWLLRNIFEIRNILIVVVAFVAPARLLIDGSLEFKCAYVIIAMAILWLTEALPIPVTALMPIFLFPMLGVSTARTVCSKYVNDTTFLFLGGLIIAVAVEEVNLHKRIALGVIKIIGGQPNMLMLGLMLPTWFLSMWISNTATTSMMLPIILAVTDQINKMKHEDIKSTDDNTFYVMDKIKNGEVTVPAVDTSEVEIDVNADSEETKDKPKQKINRMSKGFALCVAYAANIGGISTLIGTPPNLILQGQANRIYTTKSPGADSGITFANWMGFALPMSIIILFLAWIWLQIVFLGFKTCCKGDPVKKRAIQIVIDREYKKLGTITSPFTRDSTAAILMACSLFFLPVKKPSVFCWNEIGDDGKYLKPKYTPIFTWKVAVNKVPWGVVILLGGGFAMASASLDSGLSRWVGNQLEIFKDFEPWVMNLVLTCIVAAATEVTSNSATATLLMPIMADLAISIGVHPLYLMIPATIACSFAFMLPVATPPNAIVFATGYVRIPDMASAGIVMNVIALLGLAIAMNTWASPIFGLDTIPDIFRTNFTTTTITNM